MMLPLAGGCLCGAIRYQNGYAPRSADYCHCRMCRHAAGAPVVARLTVANEFFTWTTGQPAVYRSSEEAERLFCPNCGTQLALRDEPDYLDVTLASLDGPEASAQAIISGPRAESAGSIPQTTCRGTQAREALSGEEPRRRQATMGLGERAGQLRAFPVGVVRTTSRQVRRQGN